MLRYLNKANQEEAENGGTARGNGGGMSIERSLYEYGNHKGRLLLQALDNFYHNSGAYPETSEALRFTLSQAAYSHAFYT
jgi:hypothetical protein